MLNQICHFQKISNKCKSYSLVGTSLEDGCHNKAIYANSKMTESHSWHGSTWQSYTTHALTANRSCKILQYQMKCCFQDLTKVSNKSAKFFFICQHKLILVFSYFLTCPVLQCGIQNCLSNKERANRFNFTSGTLHLSPHVSLDLYKTLLKLFWEYFNVIDKTDFGLKFWTERWRAICILSRNSRFYSKLATLI